LVAEGLRKAYGDLSLLDGVDVSIHEGERIGLVGANGAGKSTLARVLAGLDSVDEGRVARRRAATVRYLAQEPDLPMERKAREIVFDGLGAWAEAFREHESLSQRIAAQEPGWELLLEAQTAAAQELERLGGWERGHRVEVMLEQLGLVDIDRPVAQLSGGERRRVALAQLLVEEPSLAILDEPTNHLDADSIEWLETYLQQTYKGALLLITHDRYILDRVATRTLEIERGKVYSYEGGWHRYLEAKAERAAHASRAEANRQNLLRTELEWLRRSPKARTSKSKARIQRAEALRDAEGPQMERTAQFSVQKERLGNTVLETRELGLSLGGRRLVDAFTFTLCRGERVGIVGPNGAGKTTLLRALLQEIEPTDGRIVVGKNTKFAYFDQTRSGLDDTCSIAQAVAGDRSHVTFQGQSIDIRSYLQRFLFSPKRIRDRVSALSGGERARVALARMLLQPANVLVLDEPTNDLDVPTLASLEQMLVEGDSTALIVSHDRYFLDRVATGILAFEGDGRVTSYAGNYSDYRERSAAIKKGAKEPASKPDQAEASEVKPKARKLSYKEKIELRELPASIEQAEASVAEIDATLADPDFYSERAAELPALVERQTELRERVDAMMARWMELEAIAAGETPS
jgi:ATP-binding cassette subfamily F protein uup